MKRFPLFARLSRTCGATPTHLANRPPRRQATPVRREPTYTRGDLVLATAAAWCYALAFACTIWYLATVLAY